jgi:hypothetical protein
MRAIAHIIKKNPGAIRFAAGGGDFRRLQNHVSNINFSMATQAR